MIFDSGKEVARVIFMMAGFVIGFVLIIAGWKMTGQLMGLGLMMVGLILLLAVLFVYNEPFSQRAEKSNRKVSTTKKGE